MVQMAIKKTDLEKIARQLRAALEIIEAEIAPVEIPPEIQAEVDRKIEKRICLAWDHVIPDGEPVFRGLCETDYQTQTARIRRGQETERDLMMTGKLGPPATRGRKAAMDIASSHKAAEIEMNRHRAAEPKGKYRKKDGNEAT